VETPGGGGSRTLIVLPTYNEAANLAGVVSGILAQGRGIDVLVVDDGSPDGTGALAERLAATEPRVSVLHRARKEGLGPAYIAGLLRGLSLGHDRLVTMDADLSHAPSDVPRLIAAVDAGADVACGSRWVRGGGTAGWPLHRRLLSRGGSAYARTLLGLRLRDVTGGFKCFRREALLAIDVASMGTTGYAFNIELNVRAVRRGLTVVEVPIIFTERVAGQSKMGSAIVLEALRAVPALRWAPQPPADLHAPPPPFVQVEAGAVELTGRRQAPEPAPAQPLVET
jgi:dolichol-phosphate mannosyltransferase